ncbi:hypothetical protein MAR_027539 [Mya arenaria]|uniref:Sodefrin-like factor n=1 Tax=Mya arenaria TaxID=6604 RepID=A0ABY7EWN5_MYAAR|nr:hypothetical protein MAR_027539 [Mya arenaria]
MTSLAVLVFLSVATAAVLSTVLNAAVGPVCYSCNSTLGIEECDQVKHCALDEICQTLLLHRIPGLEMDRYSTGCIPKHSRRCNPSNPTVSYADGFTSYPFVWTVHFVGAPANVVPTLTTMLTSAALSCAECAG